MNSGNILEALARVDGPRQDPTKPLDYLRTKLMGTLACQFNPLMKSFLSIMEEPPNFDSFRETLEGTRCFSRSDYAKAIEHFDLAAALDPAFKDVLIYKGFALHNSNEYARSEALVEEIEKSRDKLSKGENALLDYLRAWLHGNLEDRYRLIKQIAPLDPYWSHDLALNSVDNNYPGEAVEAFKKIPLDDEFYKTWGGQWEIITDAYHMLGDHKRELKEARRARKDFPESLWALRREVRAVSAMGQMKEIKRLIDESATLPSEGGWGPGETMMQAGRELRAHGYQKESVQMFEKAQQWVESRPQKERDSADGRNLLGRILMYLERWTEAQARFETLLKESPSEIVYISFCGQLAAIMGDRGKALSFSKQLEDNKTPYLFGTPTYNRALIAAFLGDKEDAVNLIREAISQGYAYPSIHGTMALERLKDYPPYIQLMKPKG
jgi:tetratricopeptide (TPR) repeat protein